MIRTTAIAAMLACASSTAWADPPRDQLLALVSAELPGYVAGVDAASLSRTQLAAIYSIMHSDNSGGDKTAMIRSVLGGRLSLRGLFLK